MRVAREKLLAQLESVNPGLSAREIIEQSSCFILKDGEVLTFNDEVACRQECMLDTINGAVKADPFLNLLRKMDEEYVDIVQNEGELKIKAVGGKKTRRQAGISMEDKVVLPIGSVDKPKDWKELPDDFTEAVTVIAQCASKDESKFIITCVHLHPEWIEACDDYQIARFPMEIGLGKPVLVRRESLKHVTTLDMQEFSESKSWLHFRNKQGLILSIRRYSDDYPDLGAYLDTDKGEKTELPKGLKEATEKAEIFSAEKGEENQVEISLRAGRLKIRGQGISGWYSEVKDVNYEGDPITFLITPNLLRELVENYKECEITSNRLKVDGGKFTYVTCLGVPKKEE